MKEAPFSKKTSRRFLTVANCWLLISAIMFVSCSKSDEPLPLAEEIDNDEIEYTFIDPSDTLNVTICEAEDIASAFIDDLVETDNTLKAAGMRYSTRKATIIPDDNNEPAMYIVNLYPEGWCIVSATKKTQSVLAFNDEGKFDVKDLQDGVVDWLCEKIYEIQEIRSDTAYVIPNGTKLSWNRNKNYAGRTKLYAATPDHTEICISTIEQYGPLLKTEWDQCHPFNYNVQLECNYDVINNNYYHNKAPIGCVATALIQVLKYWEYPTNKYNWRIMQNYYNGKDYSITASQKEVAKLAINVADLLNMDYSCDGSAAKIGDIPNILIKQFNYSSGGTLKELSDNNATKIVSEEIKNNRPVIIGACSEKNRQKRFLRKSKISYSGCHAFVCDGFKQNLTKMVGGNRDGEYLVIKFFHINWGWGCLRKNHSNGWFMIDYLNPEKEGGDDTNYQYKKQYLYNIKAK